VGFFHSTDEVAARQAEIHQAILGLNDEIAAAQAFTPVQLTAWRRFRESWSLWYQNNATYWTRGGSSVWDRLDAWARLLMGWRTAYSRAFAVAHPDAVLPDATTPPLTNPPPPEGGFFGGGLDFGSLAKTLTIGAVVIGGIYLAGRWSD
jgi:hypothetical protein